MPSLIPLPIHDKRLEVVQENVQHVVSLVLQEIVNSILHPSRTKRRNKTCLIHIAGKSRFLAGFSLRKKGISCKTVFKISFVAFDYEFISAKRHFEDGNAHNNFKVAVMNCYTVELENWRSIFCTD